METIWKYRINVIVDETDKAAMNALWTVIAPEGDAEANTFGLPLSASGNEPATHRGISTAATEEMRLLITDTFAAELSGAVISIQHYTVNDFDALLLLQDLKIIQEVLNG